MQWLKEQLTLHKPFIYALLSSTRRLCNANSFFLTNDKFTVKFSQQSLGRVSWN